MHGLHCFVNHRLLGHSTMLQCEGRLGGVAGRGRACWCVLSVGCLGVAGGPLFGAERFVSVGGAWLVAWCSARMVVRALAGVGGTGFGVGCVCAVDWAGAL